MSYKKLYQKDIAVDNVPKRIQILENKDHIYKEPVWQYDSDKHRYYEECEGCRSQHDIISLASHTTYTTDWEYSDDTYHRHEIKGCTVCPYSISQPYYEMHQKAENPTSATKVDEATHLLTYPCFRNTCTYEFKQSENHTYDQKISVFHASGSNQYHSVGYKCDRSNIGCNHIMHEPSMIEEHDYWAKYGKNPKPKFAL